MHAIACCIAVSLYQSIELYQFIKYCNNTWLVVMMDNIASITVPTLIFGVIVTFRCFSGNN